MRQAVPMTTVLPMPAVLTTWVEAKSPEGRVYYSNTATGESTFEKPYELKSAAERQLPTSVWKEYCKDGRCYYVNSDTKASSWEEPVEYTKFKLRLKSLCAGEAPTKDQVSLAVYMAARKAVDELVIDLDGSYARKKAEEASAAAAAEAAEAARKKQEVLLTVISGDLESPPRKRFQLQGDGKAEFLRMLDDWKIPGTATWEEAFAHGIAADPRFEALKTKQEKQATVSERRAAAMKASEQDGQRPLSQKAAFDAYLDELEKRGVLGPKSLFYAIAPIIRYEKKMPPSESDARAWFDYHIEQLAKRAQKEKEERDRAMEAKVHDQIANLIPNSESLSKAELFSALSALKTTGFTDLSMTEEDLKRFCGTFASRMAERREAQSKDAEHRSRDALREGLKRAFGSGAISTESRYSDFKVDEDLRTKRAPYLAELLLPLVGNEAAIEKEFRSARDDAKDLIVHVAKEMREAGWVLPNASIKRVTDVADGELKLKLQGFEDRYGSQIVQKAFEEYIRRVTKDKERFFELLDRYVREPQDAVWEKIQPLISDRTAYKDMGSDEARKLALEEFVQTLSTRARSSSDRNRGSSKGRTRSRSRDRRRDRDHHQDRHRRY
jgi:hypothetical protein